MAKKTDTKGLEQFRPKFGSKVNQLHPALISVCANLIPFPQVSSPTRIYMVGNMLPKSVRTNGRERRTNFTGFEKQYGDRARKIVARSNMIVEDVFYVESVSNRNEVTDQWNEIYVIFKNDEVDKYDLLVLPRYNTQNHYVGFEYIYDKRIMQRLGKGATFPKGTVFARSPGVNPQGEWDFSMNLRVASGSFLETEEDGIEISESCAKYKLACMFEHDRSHGWDDSEYVPLLLFGTEEDPSPFPQSGELVREDGVVMGFRKRVPEKALVTLTTRALRRPDFTHDILFVAPPGCEVMSVEVVSEKMKNRSNNRSTDYIEQKHTRVLERYERKQNEHWNRVLEWYASRTQNGVEPRTTHRLNEFIRKAEASWTRDRFSGKVNNINRGYKREQLRDWNVTIKLKQIVDGAVRFKMAGINADKGVIVKITADKDMPSDEDGPVDIKVNNTPAFRRQIYSMLMEQGINFIGNREHKRVKELWKKGDWQAAWAVLILFWETVSPEYALLAKEVMCLEEDMKLLVEETAKTKIRTQFRSDASVVGVEIINRLRKVYTHKPGRVWITDVLGERVLTDNPIMITNQEFLLLDKFGTDASAQSFPISNPFGMPGKPNDAMKYSSFIRDFFNRNTGETEGRARVSQTDGREISKNLAMAYSPELRTLATQRIIRADDPFNIDLLVKPNEYGYNRPIRMAANMLSDSGYILREELPSDRSDYVPAPDDFSILQAEANQ